jgi:hypothetical protein
MQSPESSSDARQRGWWRLSDQFRFAQVKWDWRGWVALLWALWWGWFYAMMVLETKFPQAAIWMHMIRNSIAVYLP